VGILVDHDYESLYQLIDLHSSRRAGLHGSTHSSPNPFLVQFGTLEAFASMANGLICMRGAMSSDRDEPRLNVDCHDCERTIRLAPEQLRAAIGLMCPACGRDLTTRGQAVLREFDASARR
jgi:hypothetical protein